MWMAAWAQGWVKRAEALRQAAERSLGMAPRQVLISVAPHLRGTARIFAAVCWNAAL